MISSKTRVLSHGFQGGERVNAVKFEDIVDAFYAPLFRFAISLARTEPTAADLTQQTFYLWATRGHQLRDSTKAKSWLFTTLYREFLGFRRAESRFVPEDCEGAPAEMHVGNRSVADSIDGVTALSALQQMREVYRVPLTLFYLQELSYREIAAVLNVPPGTVMSRLSRGKGMLRKILCGEIG
jgi:RNA polymerase sigma-70 factor (ECF subfamily)